MVYLVYFLAALFIFLGFLLGISLGWLHDQNKKAVGNLIVAPGEEEEPPYIFLDLGVPTEYFEGHDYILLKIKRTEAREKQAV